MGCRRSRRGRARRSRSATVGSGRRRFEEGELGFTRPRPEPRPGFSERFGKAATHRGVDGLELDLHRTLVVGPFGLWLEPDELFEHAILFHLWGRELRRLDDTALVLHACLNA